MEVVRREEEAGNGRDEEEILPHSYKPFPIFHKRPNENTKEFYGIEMEFNKEKNNIFVLKINHEVGNKLVYIKHDGSVWVEVVTHPLSYDYFRTAFQIELECIIQEAKNEELTNCSCGIHIHLSKNCLNETQKKMLFFFVNHYRYKLRGFSHRNQSSWFSYCQRTFPRSEGSVRDKHWLLEKIKRQDFFGGHYKLINETEYTIELRLWQMFININYINSTVIFYKSIVDYIRIFDSSKYNSFDIFVEDISFADFYKIYCNNLRDNNYNYDPLRLDYSDYCYDNLAYSEFTNKFPVLTKEEALREFQNVLGAEEVAKQLLNV